MWLACGFGTAPPPPPLLQLTRSRNARLALLKDLRLQARAEAYLGPSLAKSWMAGNTAPASLGLALTSTGGPGSPGGRSPGRPGSPSLGAKGPHQLPPVGSSGPPAPLPM
jgi:hypothetical protein